MQIFFQKNRNEITITPVSGSNKTKEDIVMLVSVLHWIYLKKNKFYINLYKCVLNILIRYIQTYYKAHGKSFIFLLFKHLMANNGLKSANESYTHLNCFPHLSAGLSLSLNIKKSNPSPNTAPAWPAGSPLHPLVYI